MSERKEFYLKRENQCFFSHFHNGEIWFTKGNEDFGCKTTSFHMPVKCQFLMKLSGIYENGVQFDYREYEKFLKEEEFNEHESHDDDF